MDDLSRFCCLNSECPDHGERGAGNLAVTSRYGPEGARRRLRRRTCKARSSERKGTPPFDARLPTGEAESVLERVAEGRGVRQAGRLCKVSRGTAGRLGRLAGAQARDPHDELVAVPPRRARSSSTRGGRSSPGRGRTATPTARPTTARGTPGITSRSTRRAA